MYVMTEEATFGEWLRKRRRELDLTQEDLAERVGCSVWLVQKLESGSRRASRQTAEILVECLDVAPDERSALVRWARTGRVECPARANPIPQLIRPAVVPAGGARDGRS